ncbi:Signal peptidase I [Hyphomicrobiales bacterium]|nr:Signal peptidase I [Hyphomicrobiales bacterium]CAH1685094.1 Signal peptidase I [Hyphomicrobiales bacterium]
MPSLSAVSTTIVVGFALMLGAILGATVHRWIFFVIRIQSWSMCPTLMPGQFALVTRVYSERSIARGHIVVAASDELGLMIIKRVIGTPGDVIDIDGSGRIKVNNLVLVEPYIETWAGPAGTFIVPPQHVLLLGDNRSQSIDSRQWQRPFLPVTAIRGRLVFKTRRC